MLEFTSFLQAAEHCARLELAQHDANKSALTIAAKFLQKKVKEKYGTYQDSAGPFIGWAELTDATKADRERQGYPEDEPLLRSGEVRDSCQIDVKVPEAVVGTDNQIAEWEELGTKFMPPRSTYGIAGVENAEKIAHIVGKRVFIALTGRNVFEEHIEIDDGIS